MQNSSSLVFYVQRIFLYRKTPIDRFSLEPTKRYLFNIFRIYLIWSLIYLPLSLKLLMKTNTNFFKIAINYLRDFLLTGSYTQLWYLNGLMVAVGIISFLLYRKWKPEKILIISFVFYIIGMLGNAHFGVVRPLLRVPFVGRLIRAYFKIFITTRNGLFFAFFFVSLGMILSNREISIGRGKSLVLFVLSAIMLCAEAFVVATYGLARGYGLYVFAIPSAIFCFLFLKSLKLNDREIYKKLRSVSALIYYGHLWIGFVVGVFLSVCALDIKNTPIQFVITLFLTVLVSMTVVKLSEKKWIQWLKKMY